MIWWLEFCKYCKYQYHWRRSYIQGLDMNHFTLARSCRKPLGLEYFPITILNSRKKSASWSQKLWIMMQWRKSTWMYHIARIASGPAEKVKNSSEALRWERKLFWRAVTSSRTIEGCNLWYFWTDTDRTKTKHVWLSRAPNLFGRTTTRKISVNRVKHECWARRRQAKTEPDYYLPRTVFVSTQ